MKKITIIIILFLVNAFSCTGRFYENRVIEKYGYSHIPLQYVVNRLGQPHNIIDFDDGDVGVQWYLGDESNIIAGLDKPGIVLTAVCEWSMRNETWMIKWTEKSAPPRRIENIPYAIRTKMGKRKQINKMLGHSEDVQPTLSKEEMLKRLNDENNHIEEYKPGDEQEIDYDKPPECYDKDGNEIEGCELETEDVEEDGDEDERTGLKLRTVDTINRKTSVNGKDYADSDDVISSFSNTEIYEQIALCSEKERVYIKPSGEVIRMDESIEGMLPDGSLEGWIKIISD